MEVILPFPFGSWGNLVKLSLRTPLLEGYQSLRLEGYLKIIQG